MQEIQSFNDLNITSCKNPARSIAHISVNQQSILYYLLSFPHKNIYSHEMFASLRLKSRLEHDVIKAKPIIVQLRKMY